MRQYCASLLIMQIACPAANHTYYRKCSKKKKKLAQGWRKTRKTDKRASEKERIQSRCSQNASTLFAEAMPRSATTPSSIHRQPRFPGFALRNALSFFSPLLPRFTRTHDHFNANQKMGCICLLHPAPPREKCSHRCSVHKGKTKKNDTAEQRREKLALTTTRWRDDDGDDGVETLDQNKTPGQMRSSSNRERAVAGCRRLAECIGLLHTGRRAVCVCERPCNDVMNSKWPCTTRATRVCQRKLRPESKLMARVVRWAAGGLIRLNWGYNSTRECGRSSFIRTK